MAATSTAKQKTQLLFKIAAELNIGRETIVEFLQSKGFDLPNKPTSKLTEEMHDLVMNKFEKEHRQIEKQRRKVDAYHQRRTRPRKASDQDKDIETEEAREVPQETPASAELTGATEEVPADAVEQEPIAPETESVPETEEEPEVVEAEAPAAPVEEPARPVVEAVAERQAPREQEKPETVETPVAAREQEKPETVEAPVAAVQEPVAAEEEEKFENAEGEEEKFEDEAEVREIEDAEDEDEEIIAEAVEEAPPVVEKKPQESVIKKPMLKGLSVVGKIDISKQEEAGKAAKKKRKKRKRIRESKSVDINAEVGTSKRTGTTTGAATGAAKPAASGTAKPTGTTSSTAARSGTAGGTSADKRKRKRKGVSVDQDEVQRAIRETFSRMDDRSGSARQKRSKLKRGERQEQRDQEMMERMEQQTVLSVAEYATVAELANLMNVDVSEVISKCIGLGLMVSINQRLDKDTIQLVADEFGYSIEFQEEYAEDLLVDEEDAPEDLKFRAPIVTIMGHVDHGKTSLLDYVRRANVVAGEAGGITQHIGAYSVELEDGRHITFLDTPGHEAFTAMRARGAQVTDIVVLIVAADDSVMPQTLEAISHAQAAGVPMVVAINKVDKPEANPDRIKQQLADRGVLVESWGGKHQAVEISAKKGTNVDKLLEALLLEAELLDLKANPDRHARGTIIEAEVDKGRGPVATVLVQKGTLKIGDPVIAGQYSGRIRAMMDERGHRVKEAGPSTPVQVLGLDGVPTSGDTFVAVATEQEAREIATKRQQLRREQDFKQARRRFSLDDISQQIAEGAVQDLPLIIKGDVDGSVEALGDALLRLSTPEVQVSIVMKAVGEITESDVLLAAASNAIILGFHVRPNLKARKLAEAEGVDIRTYRVIYDTVNEIRAALEGLLAPEKKEEITATVEVRDVFKISRVGTIAGCYVQDGKINRNDKVRLLRDGLEVYDGTISSLKRHKDDVREVEQGYECGITLENMNDVKIGDIIEAYRTVEIKRKLEGSTADAG